MFPSRSPIERERRNTVTQRNLLYATTRAIKRRSKGVDIARTIDDFYFQRRRGSVTGVHFPICPLIELINSLIRDLTTGSSQFVSIYFSRGVGYHLLFDRGLSCAMRSVFLRGEIRGFVIRGSRCV